MNHSLFSENMKLADLIHTNYKLLFVLPRFGIELGMGDSTILQVCSQKNISLPLFLMVCNVYTFNEYFPEKKTLDEIPIDALIAYLRNSHNDYLTVLVSQITKDIASLTADCYPDLFEKFCKKYEKEVRSHFQYEEQIVFPYISSLLTGEKVNDYNIEKFEENHSNIEESLTDLKNILLKYIPGNCSPQKNREVLINLFLFEDDLNKHTLLEDKILVLLVEQIERKIK